MHAMQFANQLSIYHLRNKLPESLSRYDFSVSLPKHGESDVLYVGHALSHACLN